MQGGVYAHLHRVGERESDGERQALGDGDDKHSNADHEGAD